MSDTPRTDRLQEIRNKVLNYCHAEIGDSHKTAGLIDVAREMLDTLEINERELAARDAEVARLRKAIETVDCDAIREWCDECDGVEGKCACWVKSFSAALAQPKEPI